MYLEVGCNLKNVQFKVIVTTHTRPDHQNFFGVDETLGPVAISLKRERVPPEVCDFYNIQPSMPNNITMVPKHQWRIIFRTGQVGIHMVTENV